tara:strand:- start:135 stop:311 length:177 start_codon:yes stop_codon:yes gene_type:complete
MRFGVRLVRDDKVTVDQLEEALRMQSEGDNRKLGEILVDKGFLDQETLEQYLKESAEG